MKLRIKKILQSILVLSAVPAILIAAAAFLLLPVVIRKLDFGVIHILEYLYVAYGVVIIAINRKAIGALFVKIGHAIPFVNRMMSDKNFRFRVLLNWNVFMSFLMLVFYVMAGYHYHSFWFYSLAGYNALVMLIRMVNAALDRRSIRKDLMGRSLEIYQVRAYIACGFAILALNLAITVMAMLMTFQNQYFPYNAFLIMSIALFTLFRFVTGIANARKYRSNENRIFAATKNLDMIVGVMAGYTLQTTMLSRLPNDSPVRFYPNLFVGVVVSAFNLAVAFLMIERGLKRLKELKQ